MEGLCESLNFLLRGSAECACRSRSGWLCGDMEASADCARDAADPLSRGSCNRSFAASFAWPFSRLSLPFDLRSILSGAPPFMLELVQSACLRRGSVRFESAGLDRLPLSLCSWFTTRFLGWALLFPGSSDRISVSASDSSWPLSSREFESPLRPRSEGGDVVTVSGVGDFDLERDEWRSEGLRTGWFLRELLCVDEALRLRADDGIVVPLVITGAVVSIHSSASCWPRRG